MAPGLLSSLRPPSSPTVPPSPPPRRWAASPRPPEVRNRLTSSRIFCFETISSPERSGPMFAPPRACVSSSLTAERPRTGGDFVLHRGASQGHRDSARAEPPGIQPSIPARPSGFSASGSPSLSGFRSLAPPLPSLLGFPCEAPGSPSFIITKFLKFTIFLPCVPAYLRPFPRARGAASPPLLCCVQGRGHGGGGRR